MVATEQQQLDFYVFRLGLFTDQPSASPGVGWPHVFAETEGFQIRQSDNFDVLLGMDIIRQCDFSIARSGSWSLQFG